MTRIYIPPTVKHFARSMGRGFSMSISLSGTMCFLMCRHCGARTLEPMVSDLAEALRIASQKRGVEPRMLLVSGGCDLHGRLLLDPRALEVVRRIRSMGFRVAVHSGVVDWNRAQLFRSVGAEVLMLDLCIDELVLERVRPSPHLRVEALLESLELAKRAGFRVVPHIVVGEDCGRVGAEFRAIDLLTTVNVDQLVLVVFTPLPSTPYHSCPYPPQRECIDVLRYALSRLRTKVSLGCMRPREYRELETYALDSGVDAIANPSTSLVFESLKRGLEILNLCCSYEAPL